MREMRKISSRRGDAPGGGERFVQAHVGGVRIAAQCIKHDHLNPFDRGKHFFGHQLAIAQVGQFFPPVLLEYIPGCGG